MEKNKKIPYILLIFIIALVASIPLLSNNLNCYIGEGVQHIARAYETKQNMPNIFSKVIPQFANEFGYSWSLFSGNFSNILLTIFNIIFINPLLSYKIYAFSVLLLSGITMYQFVTKFSENRNIGLLAAGMYIMVPYHLTTLYVRNGVAELTAFMWIPMVFLGLYSLINQKRKHYYFSIGMALLFLTDISIAWCVMFLSIIYIVMNIHSLKIENTSRKLLLNLVGIVLLTSCFWMPYLETNLSAKYQISEITNNQKDEFINQAIGIRKLFVTAKQEKYVFEIGPLLIAMFTLTPMAITAIRKEYRKDYLFYFLAMVFCFFVSTKYFPWALFPKEIVKLQAPWRILLLANFFLIIVCSLNIGAIVNKLKFRDVILLLAVSAIYVSFLSGYVQRVENLPKIEDMNIGCVSGKEEEIVAGMNQAEYLPKNTYKDKFYLATRENNIYVLQGKAIIEDEKKEKLEFSAKVKTLEEKTILELPYIYYPGYEVRADGIELKTFETENGFLGISLNQNDEVKIEVKYTGTKIMKVANSISCISLLILIGIIIKEEFFNKET